MNELGLALSFDVDSDSLAQALGEALNKAIIRASFPLTRRLGELVEAAVKASPEYASLTGSDGEGQLRHQLGVITAGPILDQVVRNVREGLTVTPMGVEVRGDSLTGALRIEIIKDDYSEVIGVSGGSFTSEGGHEVPWLQWLTLEGDRILVTDHKFSGGHERRSRTGYGLMLRPGNWKIPPAYVGVATDNWLSRSVHAALPAFGEVIVQEVEKAF
jgi:hypothetical protein